MQLQKVPELIGRSRFHPYQSVGPVIYSDDLAATLGDGLVDSRCWLGPYCDTRPHDSVDRSQKPIEREGHGRDHL
jgi:hypothetical protein